MATPGTVGQWLIEQAVPLLTIMLAILLGVALLYVSAKRRSSALARDRWRRTENTFVHELTSDGFDPGIARTTYGYLQQHQNVAFPIEPMDDLDHVLGLDSEDLDQTIRDLLDATGRVYLPGLLSSPLVTVEDLVRYLQASPRRSIQAA